MCIYSANCCKLLQMFGGLQTAFWGEPTFAAQQPFAAPDGRLLRNHRTAVRKIGHR